MDHDQARLLPRYRLHQHHANILRTHDQPSTPLPRRTHGPTPPGGDPLQLRGIPVIGAQGAGGHIPGTQPEHQATR